MATRWQKLREEIKELVAKDPIAPVDIPILEKLTSLGFNCGMCEYMTDREFLCDTKDINCCREGFADYLNEEVGD